MRVYLTASQKPLTTVPSVNLARIVSQDDWAEWVCDQNGCTGADMTAQCSIILMARERGLMAEKV